MRGERTARAAYEAGFAIVRIEPPRGRVLHLCGTDVTPDATEATRVPVYSADLEPLTAEAVAALRAGASDWALLFSTRTASHFAAECDRHGLDRAAISIAAISPGALAAAGPGWREARAAREQTDAGVLAAAGLLCDKRAD